MTHPDNCTICGYDKYLADQIKEIKELSIPYLSVVDQQCLWVYISKLEARQIPCGWICHP